MKKKSLTHTQEDYLRAIYISQGHNAGTTGTVKVAKYLGLSKSTVSERLRELMKLKLVAAGSYSDIVLTKKGRAIAEKLTYKHRVAEVFLHDVLKIPSDQVHEEAHKLEHALSDVVITRLAAFLGEPSCDPHGASISNAAVGKFLIEENIS